MSAKISVIIPFYNGAAYLPECVTSVLNQTYANLEVILVDDGSTDASSRQAEEFRQRDQRVRVLHKANGGPVDSRNAGLAMATGEYVAFVDHDDRLEPTSFAQLMALQERTQAEIVMANFFFYVLKGKRAFKWPLVRTITLNRCIPQRSGWQWNINGTLASVSVFWSRGVNYTAANCGTTLPSRLTKLPKMILRPGGST